MTKTQLRQRVRKLYAAWKTRKKFIPGKTRIRYAGAFFDTGEIEAIVETAFGGWFGLGEKGEELEKALAQYIGSSSSLLTNSGSSASLLTIATLTSTNFSWRLREGDEIITPACTFPTTVNPMIQHRLTP